MIFSRKRPVLAGLFPNMSTNQHGSGLGLYMAKVILEEMNGAVKVENTGDGVCFSLIVPKISAGLLQVSSFA